MKEGNTRPQTNNAASKESHVVQHLTASALAAVINYPLWRASAMGQSGFTVLTNTANVGHIKFTVPHSLAPYVYAFQPPYKGMGATIAGMTWARAAIFWGSDVGKQHLLQYESCPKLVATLFPPLAVSTFVQIVNMPLVRSTITLQNPQSELRNIRESLRTIYKTNGISGLWHGTSAGILKSVPKYCTAVLVKDVMDEKLPQPNTNEERLVRSAFKSVCAGVAGAVLTNPLDVIRNEMFKTNFSMLDTIKHLRNEMGW
eukprot:CAMPEP_0194407360 /NCGR_PEP_ID=MMETSP0176-20130528/5392_1 /TAXON_ID=216777 /ORGANISM="Proboscia alata, Strain PI-D3" /LENGTH=257 /DNA_ID=CAMNT_0039206945 /DNA_START=110 /DNA_END=880 /DNA_ORIENTATION=+